MLNVGGLLGLFMFIYAILAINLFGSVKINFPLTKDHYNFSEIGNSLITLFNLSTGDNF